MVLIPLAVLEETCEPQMAEDIKTVLDYIEEQNKYYIHLALSEATLAARLGGMGYLSRDDA